MFTKLSILALYHRIFSLTRGWIPTLWIFASFVVALGITQPLVYIFHCLPIQFEWGTPTENIKCIDFSLGTQIPRILLLAEPKDLSANIISPRQQSWY